jgi:hypothetical protein
MLDHPGKTMKLLAALKAAVPFEVELTEWLVKQLRAQHHAGADQKHHTVSDQRTWVDEDFTPDHFDIVGANAVLSARFGRK